MNLTCMRENRWNKSQIILICDLSMFSHFLIVTNLERPLNRLAAGPIIILLEVITNYYLKVIA